MQLGRDVVLVFRVHGAGGGDFNVTLSDIPRGELLEGVAAQYDIEFATDIEWLRRLDRAEINALTAMGKASDKDVAPMEWRRSARFDSRANAELLFRRLSFHFWTRDWPEIVPFGNGLTREIHSANAALLLYDDRFRSAWYQLKPGMHVFPGGQKAPFTILLTRHSRNQRG
jgi:hypothetical protein